MSCVFLKAASLSCSVTLQQYPKQAVTHRSFSQQGPEAGFKPTVRFAQHLLKKSLAHCAPSSRHPATMLFLVSFGPCDPGPYFPGANHMEPSMKQGFGIHFTPVRSSHRVSFVPTGACRGFRPTTSDVVQSFFGQYTRVGIDKRSVLFPKADRRPKAWHRLELGRPWVGLGIDVGPNKAL